MKIECARSDYDHNISLLISFSGWLVLLGYLFYLYLESSGDLVSLILASGESTRAQYTLLILFAPLISSVLGYAVNRRILQYQEKYLKANQFKDMAEGELVEIINSLIVGFVNALDAKSHWTKGHSLRVKHYCLMMAEELGLDEESRESLEIAALLHDIGKIGTYDDILNKTEELTAEEFAQIKKHPGHAVEILMPIKKFHPLLNVIKYHHERMDGCGYPDGLTGRYIPFLAKILCVADAYDAITSRRPYKTHMSKEEAIHEIQKKVGNQFDPAVVAALVTVHQKPDFDVVINDYPEESETRNTAERLARPSVCEEMGIKPYPRAVGSTIGGVGFEG
jgi:putative nucleotidyltransferase with HDIG domain